MSLWLFRAGSKGEYESKFLSDGRVYLTWENLKIDLQSFKDRLDLQKYLMDFYKFDKEKIASNYSSQIWPVIHGMKIGDWVVLPSKMNRTIHFGEIVSDYQFDASQPDPFYHYRAIKWFAIDIPRDHFDQDLLYSLGAFMSVCKIEKNNAETRIKKMYENNWIQQSGKAKESKSSEITASTEQIDFEEYIYEKIAERIIQRFKGYKMEILIESILQAKGLTTYSSPEGADNGVDILASSGELGFGSPKICVQVKSYDNPVDRPTLDQLIGTMANVGADYGLLVSWSGFKNSVVKETAKQFFKVRLWNSRDVIKELFDNYEKLSDDIKAEIPLKRIWMLSTDDL